MNTMFDVLIVWFALCKSFSALKPHILRSQFYHGDHLGGDFKTDKISQNLYQDHIFCVATFPEKLHIGAQD